MIAFFMHIRAHSHIWSLSISRCLSHSISNVRAQLLEYIWCIARLGQSKIGRKNTEEKTKHIHCTDAMYCSCTSHLKSNANPSNWRDFAFFLLFCVTTLVLAISFLPFGSAVKSKLGLGMLAQNVAILASNLKQTTGLVLGFSVTHVIFKLSKRP